MRISFVLASANLAGGTRVVLMLAEHLRRRGHGVLIVFPPPPKPTFRYRVKALLRLVPWPVTKPDLAYFTEVAGGVKYKVLPAHRPVEDRDLPEADIVVATFWLTAEWVEALSPHKGAKVYFIQQYEANFGHPVDRVDATWRAPMRKIACSAWLADLARDRFGDSSTVVVNNGIDLSLFHAPPRAKQARPTVGFLYAPQTPVKGTAIALRVLAIVREQIPSLHVVAFGVEPLSPEFPLPEGAVYIRRPPQSQLRTIYGSCDTWLCTSTSEGFHLPPHEAMACRCPVVSTRVGGPTDLIQDGVNGYLTDVDDLTALADCLTQVLQADEGNWRAMSDAALATAARFTWEDAAARFEHALIDASSAATSVTPPPATAGR